MSQEMSLGIIEVFSLPFQKEMIKYFIDTESNQPDFNIEQENLTGDECTDTFCNIFVPDNFF